MITFLKKLIGKMARYKCLNKRAGFFNYEEIYDGDHVVTYTIKVSELAKDIKQILDYFDNK